MGVKFDMKDVDLAIERFKQQRVKPRFEEIGARAVEIAKEEGNYRNRTGNLRASNYYKANGDSLTIGNSASYATDVESRGYNVVTSAILFAKSELSK